MVTHITISTPKQIPLLGTTSQAQHFAVDILQIYGAEAQLSLVQPGFKFLIL